MFPDPKKFKESTYIGEELFDDESYELERKCQSIQKGLEKKLYTMESGLKAFGVTREQYEQYLGKDLTNLLSIYIYNTKQFSTQTSFIHVFTHMVKNFSSQQNDYKQVKSVLQALDKLNKEVEEKHAHA